MVVTEKPAYTEDYLEPNKRSTANAVKVHFKDGCSTNQVEVEYPLGHCFRREEAMWELLKKYVYNLATVFARKQQENIQEVSFDYSTLSKMNVNEFVNLFSK